MSFLNLFLGSKSAILASVSLVSSEAFFTDATYALSRLGSVRIISSVTSSISRLANKV